MDINGNLVSSTYLSSMAKTDAVSKVNTSTNALTPANNQDNQETPAFQFSPLDKITEALRNSNDGVTMLQAEGEGLASLAKDILNLRELAVDASDEEISDEQRGELNSQAQSLINRFKEGVNAVSYKDIPLLNQSDDAIILDLSATEDGNIQLGILDVGSTFTRLGVDEINLSSQENADASIEVIDNLYNEVQSQVDRNSESSTRLASYIDSLAYTEVDAWGQLSPVKDTQISEALSTFLYDQLKNNAPLFLQVQANSSRRAVLGLLKM